MSAEDDLETTKAAGSRLRVGLAAAGVAAVIGAGALLLGGGSPDQSASPDGAADVAPDDDPVPGSLPMTDGDPCTLSLQATLADAEDLSTGLKTWSVQLRSVAASAPAEVAGALEGLAASYESLADSPTHELSDVTGEAIRLVGQNPDASELIDDYIDTTCN